MHENLGEDTDTGGEGLDSATTPSKAALCEDDKLGNTHLQIAHCN